MKGHSPKRKTLAVVGTALLGALLILLVPTQPAVSDGGFLEFERIIPFRDLPRIGGIGDLCDRRIVNVRHDRFTLVWASAAPTVASAHWSDDPSLLAPFLECDDRDGNVGCGDAFNTHFITVTGLTAGTTYYVQPRIGGAADGDVIEVTTGADLGPLGPGDAAFGQVGPDSLVDPPVAPFLEDVYVCTTLINADASGSTGTSAQECALLGTDAFWNINMAATRTDGLGSYFQYSATDEVLQEACGGVAGCDEQQISSGADGDGFVSSPTLFLDSQVCSACIETGDPENVCNDIDDDCDGEIDEDAPDDDGDGYSVCDDCNDNPSDGFEVNPGATEETCDGVDNDCDAGTLDAPDADGDGYDICDPGVGDANLADCDDSLSTGASINPGQAETTCDDVDNDCDGLTEDAPDVDGDGYDICAPGAGDDNEIDCDDTPETGVDVNPGVTEQTCDGIDNDCDAGTEDAPDADGDGFDVCDDADCDDNPSTGVDVNPGESETTCDNIDNDCDPLTPDAPDADNDGYDVCDPGVGDLNPADCNDDPTTGPGVNPGASEIPANDIDEDCDGVDSCYQDLDGDGQGSATLVDDDGDGVCNDTGESAVSTDCNDDPAGNGANVYLGRIEIPCQGFDGDCDPSTLAHRPDLDGDGYDQCEPGVAESDGLPADCDDDPETGGPVNPGAEEETCDGVDNDCDGATLDDPPDGDTDGQTVCQGDCDDANDDIFFGNPEVTCDGLDNDCNAETPDGPDGDGDGFTVCQDCNDEAPDVNPGVAEVTCDGVDNDCDTLTPDAPDRDGDGYDVCAPPIGDANPIDCNDDPGDGGADINPGAVEVTCDGVDNDCDASTDDTPDADGDGVDICGPVIDCDDNDGNNFPGNAEVCDGQDNDCNGLDDAGNPDVGGQETDNDGDGRVECDGDCDDNDPFNYGAAVSYPAAGPANDEVCDGRDNDCNTFDDAGNPGIDGQETDNDGDGRVECDGDCDDSTDAVYGAAVSYPTSGPANTEVCDGLDNDCNGADDFGGFDGSETDNDGDGRVECDGDCDDTESTVYGVAVSFPSPGGASAEVCDGLDNDCNGADDVLGFVGSETDNDGDGRVECDGDCDDADIDNYGAAVSYPAPGPANTELCDGRDNDCNTLDDAGNPGVAGQESSADSDGQWECQGDCDDTDGQNYLGNTEVCDGQDNDCNGLDDFGAPGVDGQETDNDGDGQWECQGDCDDNDDTSFVGNEEICGDDADNDCNGVVNELCATYFSTRDDVYLPGNLHVHPEGVYAEDDGAVEAYATILPDGMNLDAVDLEGTLIYFSVKPGGTVANPDSSQIHLFESVVYVYDPTTGFISEHLNLGDWGLAVDDLGALDVLSDGSVAFSPDTVNNLVYDGSDVTLYPGTLYRLTPTDLTVLLDGAAVGGLDDLDAADVQANGAVLFSPATTQYVVNQGNTLHLYDANVYKLKNNGRIVLFYNAATDGLDTIDAYCFGGAEFP